MVIVLNRALKGTPAPVVVFFHTINGLLLALSFIGIEALVTGQGTRLTQYSLRQYLICLVASIFDSGELLLITVACQADRSGFVSLIGFLNIVYGYGFDQLIFHSKINAIELSATLMILIVAMGVVFYKLWL